MKKLIALLLALVMVLGLVACGAKDEPAADAPAADAPAADAPAADAPAADGEKTWKIGFANIGEIVQLQIEVKESMERAAEAAGVELVYMNNDMNGATAVQNADNMIQQEIDGFIEFNIDESVGPTIKEKMDEAGIPIIAVDISIAGTTFFGANNELAGVVGGNRLGEVAQERWGKEPDILLLVYDSTSGETPMARVTRMEDGVREIFPEFSNEKVYMVDGGSDAAACQKAVADFLTAHPDEKNIAIGAFNDLYAVAVLAAVETAGREEECIMVAQNEYGYLDYLKENPDPVENECFVGGVAYFFTQYGDYLIPAMVRMLEGEDLGEAFYVNHEVITRDNAQEHFADYLAG